MRVEPPFIRNPRSQTLYSPQYRRDSPRYRQACLCLIYSTHIRILSVATLQSALSFWGGDDSLAPFSHLLHFSVADGGFMLDVQLSLAAWPAFREAGQSSFAGLVRQYQRPAVPTCHSLASPPSCRSKCASRSSGRGDYQAGG